MVSSFYFIFFFISSTSFSFLSFISYHLISSSHFHLSILISTSQRVHRTRFTGIRATSITRNVRTLETFSNSFLTLPRVLVKRGRGAAGRGGSIARRNEKKKKPKEKGKKSVRFSRDRWRRFLKLRTF